LDVGTSEGIERVNAAPSLFRSLGLVCLAAPTTAAMTYMARAVPIKIHAVPVRLVPHLWLVALSALAVMLVVDALILAAVQRWGAGTTKQAARKRTPGLPLGLMLKRIRLGTLGTTGLASATLLVFGTILLGLPLWAAALVSLIPWLPLYLSEASWQYRHYGAYAFFGTLVLLQLGHLAEHVTQNIQLLLTQGNLAASRGVFGQLDVETVHFYWNILIWLGTGALLYRYGLRNFWLTVAFVVAGLHSVEHLYMYWLYLTDASAYLSGGWNGILGAGGLVGSALARPYLHLVYNLLEVTPFLLAYWDESRLVYDRLIGTPVGRAALAITPGT
jgi:hypothetical protein